MDGLGRLILIITSFAACIGLSIKYPTVGIPLLLLLVYSFFSVYTSNSSGTK